MGSRGPKSEKNNVVVVDSIRRTRAKPLPGMTKPAREIWKRIVKAYPAGHFKPQHFDQLRGYCEAAAAYKKAVSEIQKEGGVITQKNGVMKRNPWCNERDACANIIASLGTKLGITLNSTTVAKGKPGENKKPKSKREGLMFGGSK